MAKLTLVKGTTSYRAYVFISDSSVSTGAGLTGLVFNSASLVASYVRPGAARTAITLITQTVTGAYSSGGFVEIDATNMPGIYRLDVPDAALATGVNAVVVMLKGATNMAPCVFEIELTGIDNQDAVRAGMTALPNAVAEAAGGLYTRGTGAGQINQPANGLIDANTLRWNGTAVATPATAGIPDVNVKNIDNDAASASGMVTFPNATLASTANITGGTITTVTNLTNAPTAGDLTATMKTSVTTAATAATPIAASVTGNVGGNVTGSVGSVATGGITAASIATNAIDADAIAADAVTEIQSGLSTLTAAGIRTAVGLASANLDTQLDALPTAAENASQVRTELTTELGRIDAAVSSRLSTAGYTTPPTVGAIADQVWDEILSGHAVVGSAGAALSAAGGSGDPWATALPGAYGAGTAGAILGTNLDATVGTRATQTSVNTIDDFLDTEVSTILAAVDTEVAAIKAQTDLIPASPAAVGSAMTLAANAVTAAALATDAVNEIADGVLDRNMATGTDSSSNTVRTLRSAQRKIRNKYTSVGGVGSVMKEDDTTVAYTEALTTDAAALPITGWDPS